MFFIVTEKWCIMKANLYTGGMYHGKSGKIFKICGNLLFSNG